MTSDLSNSDSTISDLASSDVFRGEESVYGNGVQDTLRTATDRVGQRIPDLAINGLTEQEILDRAPVLACDRVHWSSERTIDLDELVALLDLPAYTRQWSDETCRVWVDAGRGDEARTQIKEICSDWGIEISNARIDRGVGFRNLNTIDDRLIGQLIHACVDWLYPRSGNLRARIVAEFDDVDDEDLRGMLYLFVHDYLDRYDGERSGRNGRLNVTAFMYGKLRNWPQDLQRARFGRTAINDRVALQRLNERCTQEFARPATSQERADALGVSVAELLHREGALLALSTASMDEIREDEFSWSAVVADDLDVAEEGLEPAARSALSRKILDAVHVPGSEKKRDHDPLALATLYLMFWEGLSRSQISEVLEVMPKTVTSALARTTAALDIDEFRP